VILLGSKVIIAQSKALKMS